MWQQEFLWFFTLLHHAFRKNHAIAFEGLMVWAVAHVFGFYNPKQVADFLEVPHQQCSTELQEGSVYPVQKMLLRFLVKQAAEKRKPVMSQSAATRSRAGTPFSMDDSVMDRFGTLLRCPWRWESGRYQKIMRGPDCLGMVCTIQPRAWPLHGLFCPKPGRYPTTKADGLIGMLTQLKTALLREGLESTQLPLTMDAADVSQALRARRQQLGCIDSSMAGTGHSVLTIDGQPGAASTWKKVMMVEAPQGGIDGPSCRIRGSRPTWGSLLLCFFRKRTTRSSSLMHLRQRSLRGAAIWHIGQQHPVMAGFWKIMKAIFPSRSRHLQGDGLDAALLSKVFASLLALRLHAQGVFSTLTSTESMRTLRREEDVRDFLVTHFPAPFSIA
jgi:hypothetical protein